MASSKDEQIDLQTMTLKPNKGQKVNSEFMIYLQIIIQ